MGRKYRNDFEEPKLKMSKDSFFEGLKVFNYIRPYKWQFILGLILLAISSGIFMLVLKLAGTVVDVAQGNSDFAYSLNQIGIALIVIFIFQGVVSYFRIYLFAIVSEKGVASVRREVYSKLLTLPVFFFEQNKTGELLSRVTADIERLYGVFSITLAEFLRQLILLIGGIIFLAVITPKLALIMLATFPLIVLVAIIFGKRIRKLSRAKQNELAETNNIMSEAVTGIRSVKSFAQESFENKKYSHSISKVVDIALKFAKARGLFAAFMVTFLTGALFFVIWQGALMIQTGEITAGELISFVSFTAVIGAAIAGLGNFYAEILGAFGATSRIREILDEDSELDLKEMEVDIDLTGNIVFENVSFSYPSRKDIPIFSDLKLQISSGQKIALVGASGAGKSTVMQLLLRFYEIDGGKIHIDNIDIKDMNIQQLRNNFSIVPQEAVLFAGTIRENILYGNLNATEEELIKAAEQSNSLQFINAFPEGLETIVGERGVKLSGGQRQRIAIARAILKDPTILLLDEATSALDSESEQTVQEALNKLMTGRTTLIIAHRLSTIVNVDKILFIENGAVAESGTHSELLAIKNGLYAQQAAIAGIMNN